MIDWRKIADQANKSVVNTFREKELVPYTPVATGEIVMVPLHFESAFFSYEIGTTISKSSEDPHCFLRGEDLGTVPEEGDLLTVQEKNYIVTHGETDGYGGYKLWLGLLNA